AGGTVKGGTESVARSLGRRGVSRALRPVAGVGGGRGGAALRALYERARTASGRLLLPARRTLRRWPTRGHQVRRRARAARRDHCARDAGRRRLLPRALRPPRPP